MTATGNITHADIVAAIEDSFFDYPAVPGKFEKVTYPGVRGRYSPRASHPIANLVGNTNLTPARADGAIAAVRAQFAGRQQGFGWLVTSTTQPPDMPQRLIAGGFNKIASIAGMYLTDLNLPVAPNPAVRVRQATSDDTATLIDLYHRGFPMPISVVEVMAEVMATDDNMVNYFAYLEESEDPVAVASLRYLTDQPIFVLGGAATLPDYRGRGLYTALVARRLADARDNGMQAAVIQADRGTSAPICAKLGFTEHLDMAIYGWMPPEDSASG